MADQDKLEVVLDGNGAFLAGSAITGKVKIDLKEECSFDIIKEFKLDVEGTLTLSWPDKKKVNNNLKAL